MGSSPSVEHGAPGGRPVQADRGNMMSPASDGHGGGGNDGSSSGGMRMRSRSRHALMKKLVKGRVVFLGLDGAGKTTLVKQLQRLADMTDPFSTDTASQRDLTPSENGRTPSPVAMLQSMSSAGDLLTPDGSRIPRIFPDPTKATTSVVYRLDGDRHVQFIDVPGRRVYRGAHWRTALQGDPPSTGSLTNGPAPSALPIVAVVFVVDATDSMRFPLVARELVALQKLKDTRTPNGAPTPLAAWLQSAPFLLVLNKVDAAAGGTGGPQDSSNSVERRRTSRLMRQQLKTAFDHQLRMDQKKHPNDYAHIVQNSALSSPPSSSAGVPPAPSFSTKRAALAEANNNRKTLLMTSLVECCAFDANCIRALHTLLHDDIRRLWSGP